jgi:CSLREA domain-containing protein
MCKISVHKFLRTWTVGLLMFVFALGAPGVQVVYAASLTVNTTDDNLTSGDGFCTLREAISNANSNSDTTSGDCAAGIGDDSITFSVSGTITLASTLPAISDSAGLTIDGAAQSITISGNLSVQVMVVNSRAVLMLQNLTIANGRSGGNGGGIENNGTLTVTNTTFSNNFAGPGSGVAGGGGIWNGGTVTVTNSTFSGNNADFVGGGIENGGTMMVINSTFSHNGAVIGGGIRSGGTLTVIHSTIINSTFSSNGALLSGGGIDNGTLSELTVTNSTFSGNSAGSGGSINGFVSVTLRNTIVANSPTGGNCSGSFIDGGGNLNYPDTTCPGINADPLLGPLQANPPGDTATHALLPGSPAIDAAVLANCPPTDQRGVPRPQGAGCDIGAFELESVIYNFSGFFPPVDNPPTFNVVNAGARIPVKFSLSGNQGLNIFASGYPRSEPIACPPSASLAVIEQTLRSGGSSLSYDATTDTYNYKWKTESGWAGTCRQLILRLNDGTDHIANFMFR